MKNESKKPEPKKRGRKPRDAAQAAPQKPERDTSDKVRCGTYLNKAHIAALKKEYGNVYQGLRELVSRFAKLQEKRAKA